MEKKEFKAESKKLLDLVINSIYTNKEIFLREIISNASDAIDKRCYLSLTDSSLGLSRSDFRIKITPDKNARTLTISDNGIGMNEEELEKNLGTIAQSGSQIFKQKLSEQEKTDKNIDVIGQFGIGFYSAFMVSSKVTVITKAQGSDVAYKWESNGTDGYTISETTKEDVGTDIIMELKADTEGENYSEFLDTYKIRTLIKKYSDYIRYPIMMDIEKSKTVETEEKDADGKNKTKYETYTETETINSMVPIWQRLKSEVTDEQCYEFYKEKFYDTENPLKVIRANVEGSVTYKAMLFIPSNAPYDFYTQNYKKGLQLYSSGVLIMDKCEDLVPDHFRFVRGVVDSQDLSLNVSREILQQDRQLKTIYTNLEKKIKNELKKMMTDEPEKYEAFYKAFGLQLKYGIVNHYGMHKDLLSDLIMFYSSTEKKLVSIADYIKRMSEEQKYIYYACGENANKIDNLPQTEQIKDKGYEMFYFTDDVDEFAIQAIGEYEGKQFKSVNSDDLGLENDEEKKDAEKKTEENKELLDFVKESLNGQVAAVKISQKLKNHPVCLSSEGPITIEMEKYFNTMPIDNQVKAQRVLEINADHSAFASLKQAWETDKEKAKKYAEILYYQSLIIADMPVDNPSHFADLVCDLM